MIGGNLQLKLPISKSSSFFNDAPEYFAYPWFFSKKGSASVESIDSPQLDRSYNIVIYKPPSFEENPYKVYPTILVFDLNDQIYNSSANLINEPIVERGTIGEYIMIGFGNYISGQDRTDLLTQVTGPMDVCRNGTFADHCNGCLPDNALTNVTEFRLLMANTCGRKKQVGGKGNDTLDFLQDTVIPRAKNVTNMRMRTDQPHLGVIGMSLGGLMACHAAWTRPNVYGFAACQSPSFWWPIIGDMDNEFFFNNVSMKDYNLRMNRPFQRIYLDVGGVEGHMMTHGMLKAAQAMVGTGHFHWDRNIWTNVFPGMPHTIPDWLTRIWDPLRIFFPTVPSLKGKLFYEYCTLTAMLSNIKKHINSFLVSIS